MPAFGLKIGCQTATSTNELPSMSCDFGQWGGAGLEPAAAQRLPSPLGPCTNTTIGVWSENSLDRTVVAAVYGQPA
jgi:hypothetical protein